MPPISPKPDAPAAPSPAPWNVLLNSRVAAAALVLAAVAAYCNSFAAPFVYDDIPTIVANRTIRHLWRMGEVLSPQLNGGLTASGRPLVNLSLAVNYAISGTNVWSYHAFNLLIHVLAGLTLFGLVRRTFSIVARVSGPVSGNPTSRETRATTGDGIAFATALLWILHPLQTESVTYVVQRAESMMGLCYLLTVYCFVRSIDSPWPRAWQAASVAASLLGVGCKEVIVTAPVIILLYDRTFIAGGFGEAWRQRRWFHTGLMATWLPLAWLVMSTGGDRGGTFEYTSEGFGGYWLVQFEAIARYLQLSFWPRPLIFDYGFFKVKHVLDVLPNALLVLALIGATLWALVKKPVPGFFGACFFGILAPACLMPGTVQVIVEHRMYLPLAAVIVPVVAGLHVWLGRRGWLVCAAFAVGCGWLTWQRNEDYRSNFALWSDTVAKQPGNARAHVCLGVIHAKRGQWPEARAHYEQALRLQPGDAEAHNNLGNALIAEGDVTGGMAHLEQALHLRPDYPLAEYNLGVVLSRAGRPAEALLHFERAVRLQPDYAEAELGRAVVLTALNRLPEALLHFEKAVELDPDSAVAHKSYGSALVRVDRFDAAVGQFTAALRLNPDDASLHVNLMLALRQLGRTEEAARHHREALRLNPGLAPHHTGTIQLPANNTNGRE